jgi:hypothetical protein
MQAPTIKLGPYAVEEALETIGSLIRRVALLVTGSVR